MKTYIRLQSKKYEINENSKSFEWDFGFGGDMWDAMYDEIGYGPTIQALSNKPLDEIAPYEQEILDRYYAIDGLKGEERKTEIESMWEQYGLKSMVLPGVSCFENTEEGKQELKEYFLQRVPEWLEDDEHYILIFEGINTDAEGHNGESVVIWQKDIARIETKEFFK